MFNWFRRQRGDSPEEKKSAQSPEPTPAETTETTEDNADVDENYLEWAKAAFQNIQQRQTSEESEDTESAQVEEEAETAEPTEVVLEPETDNPEIVAIEEQQETEVEVEVEEEVEETAADVPAWMRKSDGLERLRETAIEIEETPETSPSGIAFDEDFIWSSRVLASQGRSPDDVSQEEIAWLKQLRQGLGKTRRSLVNQLKSVVGQGPLNDDAVMEIEALLLQADVGVEATDYIIETLQDKLKEEALPPEEAIAYLKTILQDILDKPLAGFDNANFEPEKDTLNIWMMTGVNGAGKTTTIGKLANLCQKSGYTCLIAAADTFRAAAVEQVKVWGERANTPVIANPGTNTDPAAVVFDAITAAQSRQAELLLVDTAGRLQNKKNLMDELAKIRRIVDKKAPGAKIESLLVLDATLGQNGLRQAQVFSEAAKLSGVVLTKLDGSAKGGVALAVAQQLNLPIRFVGAGEGIEDLRPFSSYEFVEALLSE